MESALNEATALKPSIVESESALAATVGRVMTTLLSARPRKLEDAVSRLSSAPKRASAAALDESVWFLHRYVRDAVEKKESLDNVLVPMIEHSLKCRKSKHGSQTMILLNWFFADGLLLQAVASSLADMILQKEDRFISLGWCVLVRSLLQYDKLTSLHAEHGKGYCFLLKIFSSRIPHLLSVVRSGSIFKDGHEFPTRLAVAAADCVLALTESLADKQLLSDPSDKQISPNLSASAQPFILESSDNYPKKIKSTSGAAEVLSSTEMGSLLWRHVTDLIVLLKKLLSWNQRSRSLHANGLERVIKWLQEIHGCYEYCQDEAGSKDLKAGVFLLASCWKHYGMLLHLEDHKVSSKNLKELLDQYLSGIEFYTENCPEQPGDCKESSIETRKFFLDCLSLLLGRLDCKQLESSISEQGFRISQLLISQLHCSDEDVIDEAICIFKEFIFKIHPACGSTVSDTEQMNGLLPVLLNLMDGRDGAAKAAVKLIAEYCSISRNNRHIQTILKRLSSENVSERRNAMDIVSEFMSKLKKNLPNSDSMWLELANCLLERLGDEEVDIRSQASHLLPVIEPTIILPGLIQLVFSSNERKLSHTCDALMAVLKSHKEEPEVIIMLLDCLSNSGQVLPKSLGNKGEGLSTPFVSGSELVNNRVLRLIQEWSKIVDDWDALVGALIDKMFSEPTNAFIVRFLSSISEYLAEAVNVVFHRVLMHTKKQKLDETMFWLCTDKTRRTADSLQWEELLFERLCPLLVLRMLPLRVFDDTNSLLMYGEIPCEETTTVCKISLTGDGCVAALLFNRAFCKFEFEDVRKLAAELCGRIHPQVLFPNVSSQLHDAAISGDILKIKACLFSVCTSLVIRGNESISHTSIVKIRDLIETILLWPSLDDDEVYKAQHGCIDCLALMICTELQNPKSSRNSSGEQMQFTVDGHASPSCSVLNYVIHRLMNNKIDLISVSRFKEDRLSEASFPLPFRLCMANVLISACQKISDPGRKALAREILPSLTRYVQAVTNSEIRAACVQIFFSCVYHLKSAVLPFGRDLFKLSLKFLESESDKERMAGVKLMSSLMASDDAVLESISGELLKAKTVLSTISLMDPSMAVRQVCDKLLECIKFT